MPIKASTEGLDRRRAALAKIQARAQQTAMVLAKSAAANFVINFRDGIREGTLRLDALRPRTKAEKEGKGYPYPSRPLYGKGGKNSYQNMMKATKIKNGWKVNPSTGKHHESKLTLDRLFNVHEFGSTFVGAHGGIIRIPPRPAGRKAREKTLKELKTSNAEFKRAINRAVAQGREDWMEQYEAKKEAQAQKVAEAFA